MHKSAHGHPTTTPNQEFADLNPRVHFLSGPALPAVAVLRALPEMVISASETGGCCSTSESRGGLLRRVSELRAQLLALSIRFSSNLREKNTSDRRLIS